MTTPGIIALLIGLIGVASAHAEDAVHAPTWSLGGAALAASDSARITMWQDSGMSAGIAPSSASLAESWSGTSGLQTGGFLAWQSSIYRVDATFSASVDGQTIMGLGASIGDEDGTRYGLRIGTAWAPTDRFTINPASGLGLAELAAPTNNVNISFLVNHALSPNLSVIGLAEAQRSFGISPLDSNYNSGMGRLIVGAGIGYKF